MESFDSCGKPVEKGSYVLYAKTGTIEKVIDIKNENNEAWAKIDRTELWYNSHFILAIDKAEEEKIKSKLRKKEGDMDKVRKMTKFGENVDMSSELCDGGG